ncbi:hypothetical protein ACHAPA_006636, partial [Fusarium lateritium]
MARISIPGSQILDRARDALGDVESTYIGQFSASIVVVRLVPRTRTVTLVAYQTFQKRRRDGSLCVISMASAQPKEARDIFQPVMAWIVKSDQCRTLDGQQN